MRAAILPCMLLAGAAAGGGAPAIVSTRLEWEPGLLGWPGSSKVLLLAAPARGVVPPG